MAPKDTIGAIEKAFKVLDLLASKKKFTTNDLARELECSPRNARRYVSALKNLFGESLEEIKKGKYRWKGIEYLDDKLKGSHLIRLMRALIELGERIGENKKYWNDLKQLFSTKYSENELNKILFDKIIAYESIKEKKEIIESAISGSFVLKFEYRGEKFYKIEPYQVILDSGLWYVAGVDKNDGKLKTFSIDLMENIDFLKDEFFIKKKNIFDKIRDLTSVWQVSSDEELEEITIEVKAEISYYFERKEYFLNQKIIKKMKNGNLKIKFYVRNEEDFKLQIFHWLPFVKIISPDKYKKFYIKILKEALEFQKKKN